MRELDGPRTTSAVGRDVEIAFVNRSLLHVRREVVGVTKHPVGGLLVTLVVTGKHDELGTQLARPCGGHRGIDAELACFVGGRRDDSPRLTADGDGFAAQSCVRRLLYRGEEGVGVEVNDCPLAKTTTSNDYLCQRPRKCLCMNKAKAWLVSNIFVVLLFPVIVHAQNLFVSEGTESGGSQIFRFTPDGVRSSFVSGLYQPGGLAFNMAGDLFAGVGGTTIYKFSRSGVGSFFANGLSQPNALAFNSSGDLFVGDVSGNIYRFTPDGLRSTFAHGSILPVGLAFSSVGDLFVADNYGSIARYTPEGAKSTFASVPYPDGVAFNTSGDLFVSTGYGTILKFTPGGVQSTFASGLGSPFGLAFDNSGNLFVGSYQGNIYRITPNGVRSTFASGLNGPQFLTFEPVPEPSVLSLGVLALFAILRRSFPTRRADEHALGGECRRFF